MRQRVLDFLHVVLVHAARLQAARNFDGFFDDRLLRLDDRADDFLRRRRIGRDPVRTRVEADELIAVEFGDFLVVDERAPDAEPLRHLA